ncbi:MAG: hypothetical protein AB1393_11110, partial [Candidatus Edwardsbacteria bacterium]
GTEGGEGFSFPRHKCRGYSYFDLRSFFLDTLIVKYLCDRPLAETPVAPLSGETNVTADGGVVAVGFLRQLLNMTPTVKIVMTRRDFFSIGFVQYYHFITEYLLLSIKKKDKKERTIEHYTSKKCKEKIQTGSIFSLATLSRIEYTILGEGYGLLSPFS